MKPWPTRHVRAGTLGPGHPAGVAAGPRETVEGHYSLPQHSYRSGKSPACRVRHRILDAGVPLSVWVPLWVPPLSRSFVRFTAATRPGNAILTIPVRCAAICLKSPGTRCKVRLGDLLPEPGHPLRRCVLQELVRVDQELRWKSGDCRLIESYLSEWPELGSEPAELVELLEAECLMRTGLGQVFTADELQGRFPAIASRIDLEAIVSQARDETENAPKWQVVPGSRESSSDSVSSASNEQPPLAASQQFGRYAVKSLLGEGGMGWVYHAYDTLLQRDVALKIPRFAKDADDAVAQRFLRESRAAAASNIRMSSPSTTPETSTACTTSQCAMYGDNPGTSPATGPPFSLPRCCPLDLQAGRRP